MTGVAFPHHSACGDTRARIASRRARLVVGATIVVLFKNVLAYVYVVFVHDDDEEKDVRTHQLPNYLYTTTSAGVGVAGRLFT